MDTKDEEMSVEGSDRTRNPSSDTVSTIVGPTVTTDTLTTLRPDSEMDTRSDRRIQMFLNVVMLHQHL